MAEQQLAVVTGTSAGIGRAVAEALLQRGWHVLGLARRVPDLQAPGYRHVALDLADPERVERYFTDEFARAYPAKAFRRVGLVNNAALVAPLARLPNLSLGDLARTFTINTVVPVWLMGFFLRHCPPTPLRIVNLSTGAARTPRAGMAAYCTSKAALLMAGGVFGDELAHPIGGRVPDAALFSFEPGTVATDMQLVIRGTSADDFPAVRHFEALHEQGKLLRAAGPAGAIADFLAQERAAPFSEGRFAG